MIKFREHRGSYQESILTECLIAPNRKDLLKKIKDVLKEMPFHTDLIFHENDIVIELYSKYNRDKNWENTYIVTLKGGGVVGFLNGFIE